MRRLIAYCRSYWAATGSLGYLLSTLALAALLVYAYYGLHIHAHRWAFYTLPYWAAFGLQYLFKPSVDFHKRRRWWMIVLGAPILFGIQSILPIHGLTLLYLIRSCVLIVPVFFFWLLRDRGRQPFYGLQQPDTWSYYPYLVLFMVPILLFAAAQPDFLLLYPRAKVVTHPALFEASYGLDLFSTELFFRGLLILGMMDKDRARAVLPMAVFYCAVHFGKPMAECASSFFGGLLLGIIALESRSIYVGVLLHLCLAWGLEVMAALHPSLPSLLP